ncbi:hypothetical protein HID58_045813 [Brassica napus]|uniref:Uncharacterized protein n=1 Tax=Brassica napus TaxID=3708 RepID=A0ABQ8AW55_BRANA|nr:hypothetical protein HID58_045813 [Brassica napus]
MTRQYIAYENNFHNGDLTPTIQITMENLVKRNTIKDLEAVVVPAEKQMCLGSRGAGAAMEEASPVNSGNVDK